MSILALAMQQLYSFIQTMSSAERRIVRSYFSAFSSRNETSPLFLKLFDYLSSSKEAPTDEQVCKHLYKKPNTGYRMLKARFRNKVLDALILDVNIDRKESLDETDYASIIVRKKLSQYFHLFNTRGSNPIARELLDSVIKLSSEYEIYPVLIDCLNIKKHSKGFIKGVDDFKAMNKQIADVDYCNTAKIKAVDYYYQITMWDKFHPNEKPKKKIRFLENCIVELKKDYELTQSASVNYYLKLLEVFYYDLQTEYVAAKDACAQMFDTLSKHKAVFRKQRIGFALGNMGHYHTYLGNFTQAIESFHKAQTYFPELSNNVYLSKEQEFYALFYSGKLDEAEKICKQLLKAPELTHGSFRLAQYKFYYAAVLFSQKNYKGALKQLAQQLEISTDKTGWEVSLRLLNIMCCVELDRPDCAQLHTNNLRKHLENNPQSEFTQRDKLIVRLISAFAKNGFSRHNFNHQFYNSLQLLNSDDKNYQWKILSPELIPFHEWMSKKLHYTLPQPTKHTVTKQKVLVRI